MADQSRINLIYVASIGRSGSTLLESILGAHSQIETCGEVHLWPHEILQGGVRLCGSGHYVQDCPFWMKMRRRVDPLEQPAPRIHFFREQHHAGRTLRIERLGELGKRPPDPEVAQMIQTYGENNYELFQAFSDVVEETTGHRPRWVVDASKDPYRLLWLLRSGRFNLKMLHLVKNPRGFAYSVTKDLIRQNGHSSDARRLYYTARQSLAWVIQNHLFAKIARNHVPAADHILLQYEELAAHPKEAFQKVCRTIGCAYEEQAVENFRAGSTFTIAGNPMRYEDRGIKLDERWKTHLPASSRRIAELITSVSRADYGYN